MKKLLLSLLLVIVALGLYFLIRQKIPTAVTTPAGWVNYTGRTIKFMYPKTLGANIWKVTTRPPKITSVLKNQDALALGCPLLKESGIPLNKTEGNNYILYTGSDIGAGILYTSECYIFSGKNETHVLNFEIRSPSGCGNGNCGAYCGTQYEQECKTFDFKKDVQEIIDTIIFTVTLL